MLTTPLPAMLSATPPTTSQHAGVLLEWRVTPTCSASELSAESIKTVPKTQPVSPRNVATIVYMKTPVLPPPLAQWRCRMRPGVPWMMIVLVGRRVSTDNVETCVTVALEHNAL